MPAWANTQPIVVGDRIFTTAEPNLLVCIDARTGKILWTDAVNPWELIGVEKTQAAKVQAMYDIWRDAIPHFERMRGSGTMTRLVPQVNLNLLPTLSLMLPYAHTQDTQGTGPGRHLRGRRQGDG